MRLDGTSLIRSGEQSVNATAAVVRPHALEPPALARGRTAAVCRRRWWGRQRLRQGRAFPCCGAGVKTQQSVQKHAVLWTLDADEQQRLPPPPFFLSIGWLLLLLLLLLRLSDFRHVGSSFHSLSFSKNSTQYLTPTKGNRHEVKGCKRRQRQK
jgi:hypothetical protein